MSRKVKPFWTAKRYAKEVDRRGGPRAVAEQLNGLYVETIHKRMRGAIAIGAEAALALKGLPLADTPFRPERGRRRKTPGAPTAVPLEEGEAS